MLKLKALLLTQGMHGMVSQVEGLANALKLKFKHQTIKLKPFWNWIPPKFTPISENLLTEKFVCDCKDNHIMWTKKCNSFNSIKKKIWQRNF